MSRISDLRDSEKNKINFIRILGTFMDDTKYIIMYQKLFKDFFQENYSVIKIKETIVNIFPEIDQKKLDSLTDLEILFTFYLFTNIMPIETNKDFQLFCEYNESKLIKRNNLQEYTSFNEVRSEVKIVKEKEQEKLLEKQVVKLFENENWLILRPLTYEASLKYGATTKWCTASRDSKSYFNQYTKNGVLIYLLDKNNNIKFAIHKNVQNNKEKATYWNAEDNQIDFFDMNLPSDAFVEITKAIKEGVTNNTLAKDILAPKKQTPVKANGGYKSKTELLDQVKKQYEQNARWSEYLETRKKGYDFAQILSASGKRRY